MFYHVLPKVSSLSLIQGHGWRQLQRRQSSRKPHMRLWPRPKGCYHLLEVGGNSLTNGIFHPQNPPFAVNECHKAFLFCMYCRIECSFFWQVAYAESHHEVPNIRKCDHRICPWNGHQNFHKEFRIQCEADSHPTPRQRSRCHPEISWLESGTDFGRFWNQQYDCFFQTICNFKRKKFKEV